MKIEEKLLFYELERLKGVVACLKKDIDYIKLTCCGGGCTVPTITTQPTSSTINQGSTIALSVVVSGTAPFTYQWYKGSTAINGATNSTYSKSNSVPGDSGSYHVVITNACGTVTSANANITVNAMVTVYWGWVDPTDPNYIDIISAILENPATLQGTTNIMSGADFSADFRDNNVPAELFVVEPLAEPIKTKWYGSVLNNGNITANISNPDGDLFVAHTNVDFPIDPQYRYYTSAYATQQTETVIEFRKS